MTTSAASATAPLPAGVRAVDDFILKGGGGDDGRTACDAGGRERNGSSPGGGRGPLVSTAALAAGNRQRPSRRAFYLAAYSLRSGAPIGLSLLGEGPTLMGGGPPTMSAARDAAAAVMAVVLDPRASGRRWPPFEVGRATDDVGRERSGVIGDGGGIELPVRRRGDDLSLLGGGPFAPTTSAASEGAAAATAGPVGFPVRR